jgi:hypothetical protein
MFKRVAKRAKRKEKEEALGLDEEMKEALGMHETDSEESDSSSEDGSGSDSERDGMLRYPKTWYKYSSSNCCSS